MSSGNQSPSRSLSLALIWAADRTGGIGRDNAIPWRIPDDQKRFREITLGHPVIMGRRTWESLPASVRPLPKRHNIVVTSGTAALGDGVSTARDLGAALDIARDEDEEAFVIGGAGVYAEAMPYAQLLYVTEVDATDSGCDTFAPTIDPDIWVGLSGQWQTTDEGLRYRWVDYRRR
ncbi:dihydrofolate reductase [Gordonia jinhuaensis]|uniref:Dihydrofolate reductase n=1 Tax=Gordonia jinhuaensis TaxID=1517702 RepID=A0A916WR04_9ACTN|nr:dihydrofolate reductase [Gordonia jinhuaensis]GGB26274.1 dihydrofolate reductase [Gordonia jinhuaensis]